MQFLRAAAQPVGGHGWPRPKLFVSRVRLIVLAAVLLGAVAAGGALLARTDSYSPPAQRHPAAGKRLADMATSLQGAYSAAVGRESAAYAVHAAAGGLAAQNPAQRLDAHFGSYGARVTAGPSHVGIRLQGWGYGSSLRPLGGASPRAAANRVTYALPGLKEWYANGPLGLEQGFALARAPGGRAAGPLTLAIALSGNTSPSVEAGGHGLVLTRGGRTALRYSGLEALDARGRQLPSWLSYEGGRILLHVDAANALYPLRIDPFLQQGEKLTGSGESGQGEFGDSVALSADGNTALIGGSGDHSFQGGAWVFTRSGSTWSQQGEKLTGSGESGNGEFGWSVALSAAGNTALVGGPTDHGRVGAVWVFTRSGTTWSQQGEKLTGGAEEVGEGEFGSSVRLSGAGTTALIGGGGDDTFAGAAWVFTFSGGKWTQQGEKLTGGAEESGRGEFGASAALSSSGDTAVIGAPRDDSGVGAGWVFVFSGGKWIQQGEKLTGGAEESGAGQFGWSVALDSEANTAVIGGPSDNGGTGAAWVFVFSGGKWIQQGEKLTATGESGKAEFGWSVALSGEGTYALVGGPEDSSKTGAAWVFVFSGGKWVQQGEKLTGTGEVGAGELGYSVALAPEAETALVGGFGDSSQVGAAWAFTRSAGKWSQQGEKLVADGESGDGDFGTGVAVSENGNTALVGGPLDNADAGAAWVFTRTGSEWSQQGGKLTGAGESGSGEFGWSVALSADGNTALVGGPEDNSKAGAAWVFTRTGNVWSPQGAKLTGSGEVGAGELGYSVALAANGDTAVVGGFGDNGDVGATWVFTRAGTSWSQDGGKLTGTGESGNGAFGYSVAVSPAGTTALIGAPEDGARAGAAWVFTESAGKWTQEGEKLGSGSGEPEFGWSVALSPDGNTALIGGPRDGGGTGAAWVFTQSGGKWTQQGEKLTGGGESGDGEFGYSVVLASEGNTALIGGPEDDAGVGAVWVFSRSAGKWAQQGGKLTGAGESHKGEFGSSLALSPEGATAVIGGREDNHGVGAAWVFESATLQWHGEGQVFAEGTPQTVTSKATLVLHLANRTTVTCKLKDKETVENPNGGGAGVDHTTEFALSGCKASPAACEKGEKLSVVPGGLPWASELVIGPPIRDELSGVELKVECTRKGVKKSFDVLTGSLAPEVGDSVFEFASGSGELAESLGGKATITGQDKLKGPKKHKVITA
jgi:FG-GAP repeat